MKTFLPIPDGFKLNTAASNSNELIVSIIPVGGGAQRYNFNRLTGDKFSYKVDQQSILAAKPSPIVVRFGRTEI